MTTKQQLKPLPEIRATVERLRSFYATTVRDEVFRARLDRLLRCDADGNPTPEPVKFTGTGETQGIALVDGAGGGKTSLVDRALRHHPALQATDPGKMLYLSVRVPSPATLKSLGLEVLRQSGYPHVADRRERWHIWNLVRDRLAMLGTKVLWIDEAHDLFHSGSPREIEDMLKTLKSLMQGKDAVIVILTGIETLWQIASYDDQVKRRYAKIELPPVTHTADGRMLRGLMRRFCDEAGLEAPEDRDLVMRLIHAGRARFGRCIEQVIHAIEVALLKGANRLDISHFATAFEMQEGCAPGDNIYLSPRWSQIDLDALGRS